MPSPGSAPAPAAAERHVAIRTEEDIVTARQVAREVAKQLGFGMVDQSRVATAVSELARNVVRYAGARGDTYVRAIEGPRGPGIEVVVSDQGPGIADLDTAMRDGFSSGSGMGMGLPGTRRLMDDMEIDSEAGRGTTITIRKWRR